MPQRRSSLHTRLGVDAHVADDEHRSPAVVQHAARDAAEQRAGECSVAARADDDQVGIDGVCVGHDLRGAEGGLLHNRSANHSRVSTQTRKTNRVHDKVRGRRTRETALLDFIRTVPSRLQLSLARYVFTPDEIVDEILSHLQVTDGAKDLDPSQPAFVEDE